MMTFDIHPYVGVGPIRFGMTRDEVHAVVTSEVRDFRRGRTEGAPDDFFPTLGFFAYYGPDSTCQALEFSRLGPPTLDGQTFFERPYYEVRQWLRTLDPVLDETADGLRSYHLGIAISAPGANELSDEELEDYAEDIPEGVLVFNRGYYDAEDSA
jgi:hypothetical protein